MFLGRQIYDDGTIQVAESKGLGSIEKNKKGVSMRDYLKEASDLIFGNKVSLGDAAETNPDQVVGNLLGVIANARNPLQAMIRKAAAYGLGQIGVVTSLRATEKI